MISRLPLLPFKKGHYGLQIGLLSLAKGYYGFQIALFAFVKGALWFSDFPYCLCERDLLRVQNRHYSFQIAPFPFFQKGHYGFQIALFGFVKGALCLPYCPFCLAERGVMYFRLFFLI